MTSEPLLGASPLDAAVARRDGVAIDPREIRVGLSYGGVRAAEDGDS